MLAAFFKTPGVVELREVERPEPRNGEVLVRVTAAGICGSDVAFFRSKQRDWHRRGHEFAGVVEKVGEGVQRLKRGDLVAGVGSVPCGECSGCARGEPQLCSNVRAAGVGAFAEYVCNGEEFFFKIDGLTGEEGALIEPLTVAMQMVRDAGVGFGSKTLLMGAGPIGLMALNICKASGARAYVSHPTSSRARLEAARGMGADAVFSPNELTQRLLEREPEGVDSAMVTIPPSIGIAQAASVLRVGGTIALIGMEFEPEANLRLDIDRFHFRKLRLIGSNHNPCAPLYPEAARLLREGIVNVEKIVSHRFPLFWIKEAFEFATERRDEVIKVMIVAED